MENFSYPKKNSPTRKILYYLVGVILLSFFCYAYFVSPPRNFPEGTVVKIEPGANLRSISLELKNANIIRSRTLFETLVIFFGSEKHLTASDYYFESKLSVYTVAKRIARGEHNMAPVLIIIPEGFNREEIALVASSKLENFNQKNFLLLSKDSEGYLFPDTYFFSSTDNEKKLITSMTDNFIKKITPIFPEIISSGHTEKDIIKMASVIEREAKGDNDRAIISGILWKRISIGMPLQVDAAPETYLNKGLPKNPISNPGMKAILASIHPEKSPYLYYLHDKTGGIHYATTFTEHMKNKLRYLK